MKKVIFRLFAYLGILAGAIFLVLFIWANWTPLSPGERQDPVNFVTYDVTDLSGSPKIGQICSDLKTVEGVGGTNSVPVMNAIIVNYKTLEISEEEIIHHVKSKYGYKLKRKQFDENGKRCPMTGTLTTMARIRRTLNIRG